MNRQDITTREHIDTFIRAFYTRVLKDETIGFIFTDVVPINWNTHIPLIVDFWESILLDNPVYRKNAMEVHYAINKKIPLTAAHFDSWLQLFEAVLDEYHEGPVTELAKKRARSIAALMLMKMQDNPDKKHIL